MLSMAMPRHRYQLSWRGKALARKASRKFTLLLRSLGTGALIAAGILCVSTKGLGLGLVSWLALLTLAAVLLSLLFSYSPRGVIRLTVLSVTAVAVFTLGLWFDF